MTEREGSFSEKELVLLITNCCVKIAARLLIAAEIYLLLSALTFQLLTAASFTFFVFISHFLVSLFYRVAAFVVTLNFIVIASPNYAVNNNNFQYLHLFSLLSLIQI